MDHCRDIAPKPDGLSSSPTPSSSPTKRSRYQYTDAEWEAKKPLIIRLYMEEKKSAEEVIEALRNEGSGSFAPCRRKLFGKFEEWGIQKNGKRKRVLDGADDQREPMAPASLRSCIHPDTDPITLPPSRRASLSGSVPTDSPIIGPSDESTATGAAGFSGAEIPSQSDWDPERDRTTHAQLEDDEQSKAADTFE